MTGTNADSTGINTKGRTRNPSRVLAALQRILAHRRRAYGKGMELRSVRDELVIYKVTIETFARGWWESFRRKLEEDFELEKILIRSPEIESR